jgi:hypothetical protein
MSVSSNVNHVDLDPPHQWHTQFYIQNKDLTMGNLISSGEIRGSYGDEYEDGCLLGCDVSEVLTTSIIRAMMEAVSTSKMSVSIYQTTRHSIPEDSHLYIVTSLRCNVCFGINVRGTATTE